MLRVKEIVRVLRFNFQRDESTALIANLECDHSAMVECHPGCGHFSCPCGVSWDEGSEGPWEENSNEE